MFTASRQRAWFGLVAIAAVALALSLLLAAPSAGPTIVSAQIYGGAVPETPETVDEEGVDVELENAVVEPVSATSTTSVGTQGAGGSVQVTVPAGALPAGSFVLVGIVENLGDVAAQAPPPSDATLVVGFVVQALDENGDQITDDFDAPVNVAFTVDEGDVPAGTTEGELTLSFWNGSAWAELVGTATQNADGSFTVSANVDHFTLFGVMAQSGPAATPTPTGTATPVPTTPGTATPGTATPGPAVPGPASTGHGGWGGESDVTLPLAGIVAMVIGLATGAAVAVRRRVG